MNTTVTLRTSLEIDENLLNEAMELGGTKIKKQAIENALKEFVEKRRQKNLYDLFDSNERLIDDDYDYKEMRGGTINI
ncbi:MAG: type II toxin-antitoxin system VapB family antitoxin [Defluviitaleaceae bacterium]|nr:type II toxin-antitoxin system VapB family antitoxin [Defluviitaleaceae bacterium]